MREERRKRFVGEGQFDGKSMTIEESYDIESNSFIAKISIGYSSFECPISELWQIAEWLKELIDPDSEQEA